MRALSALLAVLAIVLARPAPACEGLALTQPWIREAPPGAAVLAGYARLSNHGRKPVVLSSFSGDDFGSVELHQSRMADGKMQMRAAGPLTIAPGSSVELSPGAYHLMLMQPRRAIAGSSRLTLHCADGTLAVDFPVRAPASE